MHIMFWGCTCMGDITVCVNKMSKRLHDLWREAGNALPEILTEYFVHSRYVNF